MSRTTRSARLGAAELGRDPGRSGRPGDRLRPVGPGPGPVGCRRAIRGQGRPPATAPGTFGVRILGRQRRHPGDPRRGPLRPASRRPVGRGRDRPGHRLVGGSRLLRAQGRAQPAPVRLVPRPAGPLGVRGAGRPPGRRPRPDRPVRAAGRAPALRRLDPAGRARRPDPALRGAQGAPGGRGPVRRRPASGRCPTRPATIAVITSPTGRGLEGHLSRPRPALAADPGRPRRGAGPGRGGAEESRRRLPQGRALRRRADRRGTPRRGSRGHDPGPRRRFARGPLGVQRRGGRPGRRRPHAAGRLRGRPRGGRDAGRFRGGRPGADAVRGGRGGRPGSDGVPGPPCAAPADGSTVRRRAASGRSPARSSPNVARSIDSVRSPSSRACASGSGCCSIARRGRSRGPSERDGPTTERLGVRLGTDPAGTPGSRSCPARAGRCARPAGGPAGRRGADDARDGRRGARGPRAAGDARPWLRHRPPRRRCADRPRSGRRAGGDAARSPRGARRPAGHGRRPVTSSRPSASR